MAKITSLILVALLGATTTFAKPLPKTALGNRDAFINSTFSPQLFMQALIDDSIQHPEIVYSQALVESGYFTSKLFLKGHNCMGMHRAEKRQCTAIGLCYKHARYRTWLDQVRDIKLWQDYFLHGKQLTTAQYLAKLHKYAADPNYLAKIRKHLPESRQALGEACL